MRPTGVWCDPTAHAYTPFARLTPIGRQCLIRQHLDQDRCLAELAAENNISERTARTRLARQRPWVASPPNSGLLSDWHENLVGKHN